MSSALQTYRLRREITQKALAALLNVSVATISRVESGHRSLPAHAAASFERLQRNSMLVGEAGSGTQPSGFEALQETHLHASNEYLRQLKKERQILLFKNEGKLEQWTKRYNMAMTDLQLAELMIAELTANDPASPRMETYLFQRAEALNILLQISEQKPEIIMVKIDGLKQELRSIKALLGKKRQFLGMPDVLKKSAPPPAIEDKQAPEESKLLGEGNETTAPDAGER